jgi:uncharacterized protein (DUF1778 family)
MTKKIGRPVMPKSKVRGRIVQFRLPIGEYKLLCAAAKRNKLSVSDFIRRTIAWKL